MNGRATSGQPPFANVQREFAELVMFPFAHHVFRRILAKPSGPRHRVRFKLGVRQGEVSMAVPLFGDNTGGEMPKIVTISLLAACAAWAQTGSIEGRILTTAGAGAPVSKAPVRVKSTTGASYAAQSAADGSYRVNGLPVGAYEVFIEYPPFFLPFHQDKVRVDEGKAARVDVRLNDVTLNTLGDGGVEFAWLLADHPAPT